jgi:hypothetical protein
VSSKRKKVELNQEILDYTVGRIQNEMKWREEVLIYFMNLPSKDTVDLNKNFYHVNFDENPLKTVLFVVVDSIFRNSRF